MNKYTGRLRFVLKPTGKGKMSSVTRLKNVLQQEVQVKKGETEWVDVPYFSSCNACGGFGHIECKGAHVKCEKCHGKGMVDLEGH